MKFSNVMKWLLTAAMLSSTSACGSDKMSNEEHEPEAYSVMGKPLYSSDPSQASLAKFEDAKAHYEANTDDADALIWYGRRTAYLGRYQDAIDIFTTGVEKFPNDFRMFRHRGHRYISTRQFENALMDFSKATELMLGVADKTEPDGLPNAQNIPLTTTQGNIRYHLGLTYYLLQDFENARRVFAEDLKHSDNDDGTVASTHWLYMSLRRLGRDEEAKQLLQNINADMNIIENFAYHRACLFYKGVISADEIFENDIQGPGNAGLIYGLANWYLYNGDTKRATEIMQDLVNGKGWAAFGYIAAEVDLANLKKAKK